MADLDQEALEAAHKAYEHHGHLGDLKTQRLSDECLSAVIRAYLSSLPADGLVPEGWVLVPREPTAAMINAAPASFSESFKAIWPHICGDIYRAMIAAAPAQALRARNGVGVKKLEWEEEEPNWWCAQPEAMMKGYEVRVTDSGRVRVRRGAEEWRYFDGTADEAKAHWQADYERRILSALSMEDGQ